jgi:peptide methionine sulfoxide reductase msrA/msrB
MRNMTSFVIRLVATLPLAGCIAKTPSQEPHMVNVRTLSAQGQLNPPSPQPTVELSESEWKALLTPEQYAVLRSSETERPFCGRFHASHESGWYLCAGCGLPLFHSSAKFESGTGWPSFFRTAAEENLERRVDKSWGMARTEIRCARCHGHLGHVFDDGPAPTGKRYCLNSEALTFQPDQRPHPRAYFAAGCFWGVQASFDAFPGVVATRVGYMGGHLPRPSYRQTCTGTTGHAETVEVEWDPTRTSFEALTRFFFELHDPTTRDRQGPDVGSQYRSALFAVDSAQIRAAKAMAKELEATGVFAAPIVTEIASAGEFFPAETYHQKYYLSHPVQCHVPARR